MQNNGRLSTTCVGCRRDAVSKLCLKFGNKTFLVWPAVPWAKLSRQVESGPLTGPLIGGRPPVVLGEIPYYPCTLENSAFCAVIGRFAELAKSPAHSVVGSKLGAIHRTQLVSMSVSTIIAGMASRDESKRDDRVLAVEDITIEYHVDSRSFRAVDGVSFSVGAGEIVGLLGESGCGKTTTALSVLRLLPATAKVTSGHWYFRGCDLLNLTEDQLRALRGAEISIIFQDPSGLNPVMRAGTQVIEVLRAHRECSAQEARAIAKSIFDSLGLSDFDRIFDAYPHQLSGGERQRIAIAQALICKPSLVIADEPTAHLDADTAAEIFACMTRMRDRDRTSFIIVSHDPEILAGVADRILVMYAGQVVEQGSAREVFAKALHPYTRALLECLLGQPASSIHDRKRFPFIAGSSPDPLHVLPGCNFSPRCPERMPVCDSNRPPLFDRAGNHRIRCFKYEAD